MNARIQKALNDYRESKESKTISYLEAAVISSQVRKGLWV
jgi:hypothetical protein